MGYKTGGRKDFNHAERGGGGGGGSQNSFYPFKRGHEKFYFQSVSIGVVGGGVERGRS